MKKLFAKVMNFFKNLFKHKEIELDEQTLKDIDIRVEKEAIQVKVAVGLDINKEVLRNAYIKDAKEKLEAKRPINRIKNAIKTTIEFVLFIALLAVLAHFGVSFAFIF